MNISKEARKCSVFNLLKSIFLLGLAVLFSVILVEAWSEINGFLLVFLLTPVNLLMMAVIIYESMGSFEDSIYCTNIWTESTI